MFEAPSVAASSSESARFTAGNSSSTGEREAEGLEWYSSFLDFFGFLLWVSSSLRFLRFGGAIVGLL